MVPRSIRMPSSLYRSHPFYWAGFVAMGDAFSAFSSKAAR